MGDFFAKFKIMITFVTFLYKFMFNPLIFKL